MATTKKLKPNQAQVDQPESYPVLESHLRLLKLPTILAEYQQVAKRCASANATYEQYLEDIACAEIQKRDSNAISRRIKSSKVPTLKELSDFDFISVPSLNKSKVIELSKCGYIPSKTNIVLMGPPGVGKTHLAIALTLTACRQGYNARFFTAAEIVNTYREAREAKTIIRLEASLRRLHLIVIDELGYLPIDRAGAEHLFGFFSSCYEQTSVIVTTNLPFAQWPSTFAGEERMTGALLDRLTHRLEALLVSDSEESYRVKQSRKNSGKKGSSALN